MKSDEFLDFEGFTLGPCKFGPLLEEILATPLAPAWSKFMYILYYILYRYVPTIYVVV